MATSACNIASLVSFSFITLILIHDSTEDILNLQNQASHLPETKFGFNEYSEYSESADEAVGPQALEWSRTSAVNKDNQAVHAKEATSTIEAHSSDFHEQNITWDSKWSARFSFGQISAVSVDPKGNIAIFHRGSRVWDYGTFDASNRFDSRKGSIQENTVVLLDKSGKTISQWGKNMFYVPHGLTVDTIGNYWITDVALHQVFKFNVQDIEMHVQQLKKERLGNEGETFLKNSTLKPSLVLGEAFVPGNDETKFCKPTAVAVDVNGDFFVSDGYCNYRIIKYNKNGERILEWGRHWNPDPRHLSPGPNAFLVPHALALAAELDYIFVADRENGRVSCFFARNGTFHREYRYPVVGTKIYSVAYAERKIYIVNGPDPYSVMSAPPVRGFVIDIDSGKIVSEFAPKGYMENPHDLAVTLDGSEIYVVELHSHKVYKFLQGSKADGRGENATTPTMIHHKVGPLVDTGVDDVSEEKTSSTSLVLSLVTSALILIGICLATAAVVARCKKRGCLLTTRRRVHWDTEKENFKLSSLLENRKSKGVKFLKKRPNTRDFSKLSTEPESSEDEQAENNLTKMI